jgi:SAM-dependent methyltransferase
MLDLIRLSPRRLFPPGGIELYRQIALLTGMSNDDEVLDVACGRGVSLEYFVSEFGVQGSGVDPDPALIDLAEARTREARHRRPAAVPDGSAGRAPVSGRDLRHHGGRGRAREPLRSADRRS